MGVEEVGWRARRWKGESMLNSSWRASDEGGRKGVQWVWDQVERSIENDCVDLLA